MPVTVAKRGKKWRVVEKSGRIAKNASGTPVDGKGHTTEGAAKRQAAAINSRVIGKAPKFVRS